MKRFSPRLDGKIFSIPTICPPWLCQNFSYSFPCNDLKGPYDICAYLTSCSDSHFYWVTIHSTSMDIAGLYELGYHHEPLPLSSLPTKSSGSIPHEASVVQANNTRPLSQEWKGRGRVKKPWKAKKRGPNKREKKNAGDKRKASKFGNWKLRRAWWRSLTAALSTTKKRDPPRNALKALYRARCIRITLSPMLPATNALDKLKAHRHFDTSP